MRTVTVTLAIFAMGLTVWACQGTGFEDQLAEARVQLAQGNIDEAIRIYSQVLQEDPENVLALVGLTQIDIDREDLESAAERIELLESLELGAADEARVEGVREDYYVVIYEQTRGHGPFNPEDPEAFEVALITLFNIRGSSEYNADLAQLFTVQARRQLGMDDPRERANAYAVELIRDASDEELREIAAAYSRIRRREFRQRDERLTRVLTVGETTMQEAEAVIREVEATLFEREFARLFQERVLPALMEGETPLYDAETEMITIVVPPMETEEGTVPEGDEELEAFKFDLALSVAVEGLTDLAFLLRGEERGTARALQLPASSFEEAQRIYDGITMSDFDVDRQDTITFTLAVPKRLLMLTVRRLDEYLVWRAQQELEGVGVGTGMAAGTGMGTGMGTGEGTAETPSEEVTEEAASDDDAEPDDSDSEEELD